MLLPVGLATILVLGDLLSRTAPTRAIAPYAILALALAGFLLRRPRAAPGNPWAWAAATAVFVAYSAPALLSGSPTFTGYISLDDTATWFAIGDRLFDGGPSTSGLAASSYEATLAHTVDKGYPLGAFVPLGLLNRLGFEQVWIFQPFLGVLAAALALAVSGLLGPRFPDRPRLVGFGAFLAAQPALLFAYGQWGGVKELTTAALLVTFAAVAPSQSRWGPRSVLPTVVVALALISTLSWGGAVWLVPTALVGGVVLARDRSLPRQLPRWAPWSSLLIVGAVVVAGIAGLWEVPDGADRLVSGETIGNLIEPLSPWQAFGVWPAGDFREGPDVAGLCAILIGVVALLVLAGLRRERLRPSGLLLYCLGTGLVAVPLLALGSPWLGAKAMAIASPAVIILAICGIATLRTKTRMVAAAALGFGILWSNWLAYRDVDLAPHDRLEQLIVIGNRIDGWGPTLLTEYESYAVRHLLRSGDPEAPSELRVRLIPLRDGSSALRGTSPDTDELSFRDLLVYRTIVTRRGPFTSRPPAPYELEGRYPAYELWRRPEDPDVQVVEHLPGGGPTAAAGRIDCDELEEATALARRSGGSLLVAHAPRPIIVPLTAQDHPSDWVQSDQDGALVPLGTGTVDATLRVPAAGRFSFWLGGGGRGNLTVTVDGEELAQVEMGLDHTGLFVRLGAADLEGGSHEIELDYSSSPLAPGAAGNPVPTGPLVLTPETDQPVVTTDPDRADGLCGEQLDWVEVADRG